MGAAPLTTDPILLAMFENAPFGIVLVSADRRVVRTNPAFTRMVGYSPAELAELQFDQLTHPEDRSPNLALFDELLSGQRDSYQFEKRYLTKSGGALWVKVTCSRTQGDRGERAMGVIEDISEVVAAREAREKAVVALRDRVQHLMALHGAARALSNREHDLRVVLEAVARLLPDAFPYECAARLTFGTVIVEAGEGTHLAFSTAFKTAGGESGVVQILGPEGCVVRPEDRAVLESIAEMLRVELERRASDLRAQRQAETLDRALTQAQMGVWESDPVRKLITVSPHLGALIGLPPGVLTVPHGGLVKYVHPDDQLMLQERLNALYTAPPEVERVRLEFRMARPGGGWRRMTASGRIEHDASGRVQRVLAVIADVTASRSLEDSARQTQKLSVMAQVSNSVARDLDAVLESVTSGVRDVEEALPPDHPARELTQELVASGLRGAALTRQLRTFGTQGDFLPTRADLSEAVSSALPLLTRVAGEQVSVQTELTAGCFAIVDRDQLKQVLLNLVANARDAMSSAGAIRIKTGLIDFEGKPGIELLVQDSGEGMSRETMSRVAEPFFTTKADGRGTGLGLSVVYGVVKRFGGTVAIESEPGRGTTFKVLLPQA